MIKNYLRNRTKAKLYGEVVYSSRFIVIYKYSGSNYLWINYKKY